MTKRVVKSSLENTSLLKFTKPSYPINYQSSDWSGGLKTVRMLSLNNHLKCRLFSFSIWYSKPLAWSFRFPDTKWIINMRLLIERYALMKMHSSVEPFKVACIASTKQNTTKRNHSSKNSGMHIIRNKTWKELHQLKQI